jgi:hypothetical protein
VIAGDGAYNEHSQPQHVAGGDGVPPLERASEAERSTQGAKTLAHEFYGRVRDAIAGQPAEAKCAWRLVLSRLAKRT